MSQAGQFYVMMSPQEVLQGQRNIAPRTGFTPKVEGVRTGRDDRRRATHNEGKRNQDVILLSKIKSSVDLEKVNHNAYVYLHMCVYFPQWREEEETRLIIGLCSCQRLSLTVRKSTLSKDRSVYVTVLSVTFFLSIFKLIGMVFTMQYIVCWLMSMELFVCFFK